ncbi:MAG: hypothetical protein ABIH25_05180 [Candidatus Woesearchaeota archaeon]
MKNIYVGKEEYLADFIEDPINLEYKTPYGGKCTKCSTCTKCGGKCSKCSLDREIADEL